MTPEQRAVIEAAKAWQYEYLHGPEEDLTMAERRLDSAIDAAPEPTATERAEAVCRELADPEVRREMTPERASDISMPVLNSPEDAVAWVLWLIAKEDRDDGCSGSSQRRTVTMGETIFTEEEVRHRLPPSELGPDGFCRLCHDTGAIENGSWNLQKCPNGCFDHPPAPHYDGSIYFPGETGKKYAERLVLESMYPSANALEKSGWLRRLWNYVLGVR